VRHEQRGGVNTHDWRGLSFNGANELIEVRRTNTENNWNVKVGQYRYDADGIRIWRKTDKWDDEGSDKTVTYAYDRAGSLPYLIKDEKWLYVWGDGRLLYQSRHDNSGTQYAHTDAQGTLIAQTEMSREIKRRFPSDIAHPIVAGWPIFDQAIQYTGHISDSWEHGPNFNYMRSRYQEQATSRFLSRDTWIGRDSRPQSKNRYAYAEGNPASRVDPSGHQSCGRNERCIVGYRYQPYMRPPAGADTAAFGTVTDWYAEGRRIGYYVSGYDVFVAEDDDGTLCGAFAACALGNKLIVANREHSLIQQMGGLPFGSHLFWHEFGHVLQFRNWSDCGGDSACDGYNREARAEYIRIFNGILENFPRVSLEDRHRIHPWESFADQFADCMYGGGGFGGCKNKALGESVTNAG
jgi:RHS repeat-associated protein